ncbi:MAG: hypothetical protein N2170_02780 [Bacteroidia bacterium]|nr:hypothetical protein [Bacteroidia bacterium]
MWLLYGANGTTGRLLLEIWRKGMGDGVPPILAGRNPSALQALGELYGLPYLCFSLEELPRVSLPSEVRLIANFAGPYESTAQPWLQYCSEKGLAYLDICGEWKVLHHIYESASLYLSAQIPLIHGAGYDTVIGEGALYFFRQRYPEALRLHLGVYTRGGFSTGTVRSALVTLPKGYYRWEKGRLHPIPFGSSERPLYTEKKYLFWSATLAELITFPAWNPDLEALSTWVALPKRYIRWVPFLEKVFAWEPFLDGLLRLLDSQRARFARKMDFNTTSCTLVEAEGGSERLYIRTPQPYVVTAWAVLRSVQLFFSGTNEPGPKSAFGRWKEQLWNQLPGLQLSWQGP